MSELSQYLPFAQWVEKNGGAVFPTRASAEWFVRNHREELVASGQLIIRRGSAGSLIGPQFDDVVLGIMRRMSRETIGRVA